MQKVVIGKRPKPSSGRSRRQPSTARKSEIAAVPDAAVVDSPLLIAADMGMLQALLAQVVKRAEAAPSPPPLDLNRVTETPDFAPQDPPSRD